MIIKLTLVGLVLVLIGVIAMSYYVNKEGFDNISNDYLSGLSLSSAINTVSTDASSAIGTPASSTTTTTTTDGNSTTPVRTDVVPEVSISGSGYNAMNLQQKAELLKDIQKVVRNEVLANRSTTPVLNGNEQGQGNVSDSTAQGQEYSDSCSEYRCPKNADGTCPPIPDMSEYIKKDQIPCWGCALDY